MIIYFNCLIDQLTCRSQARLVRLCCSLKPTTFYWATTWVRVALVIYDAVVTV